MPPTPSAPPAPDEPPSPEVAHGAPDSPIEPLPTEPGHEPPSPRGSPDRSDRDPLPGDGERRRLSPRAVPYWRVRTAFVVVPIAAVVTLLAVLVHPLPAVRVAAAVGAWVVGVAAVVVVPPLRRRVWWYAIGEEEVDLHEGLLVVTRTVVPMVRVQHVDLHRGPVSTRLGLAEIELHTAAGSVSIPALDRDEAERIRRRVAVLARVPDEL